MNETARVIEGKAVADPWAWWRDAIVGKVAPIHDSSPQTGYYRVKRKGRDGFVPVAYWLDSKTGEQRCHMDGSDYNLQRAMEIWPYASKSPVTAEAYGEFIRDGKWPDHHEAVTRSNQAPGDNSFEAFQGKVDDLVHEAEKLIAKGAAATQQDADQAADLANRLSELGKQGPDLRQADPDLTPALREAATTAQNLSTRWLPIIIKTAIYKQIKAMVITPFLNAKDAADKAARAEAAKAGAPMPEQPRGSTTKAGTRGKAIALRTVKNVTIEDRAAVLAHFADGQQMTEFLQAAAERAVRAGVAVPGVKVIETKVAA